LNFTNAYVYQPGGTFSNLAAGTHTIRIKDFAGVQKILQQYYQNQIITLLQLTQLQQAVQEMMEP
jgi:hypothetical protein